MRLPLQGGLAPVAGLEGAVVEIACDESGFSGSNLLDPTSPVITHASVDLRADEAAELIATLRAASRFSLDELKSGQLLRRPPADRTRERFLDALTGRAHVHLVDKEFFLATRIVDLFLAEPSYADGTRLTERQRPAAVALHRARRRGGRDWPTFLTAFVELVRTKRRRVPDELLVARFFEARDALLCDGLGGPADAVLSSLRRPRVREVVDRLVRDDRSIPPPLEPMLPALAETVLFWSGGVRQVLVVHDEQSALTSWRLQRLQETLAGGSGASPFAGLVAVDSRDDPRVQVADLLAGVARRSAETGYDDLLAPYVSPTSLRDADGQPAT